MAIASAIIGCIALVRKKTLFGESLSHSAYPGVILGILISVGLGLTSDVKMSVSVLFFGFIFSLVGLFLIEALQKKFKLSSDTAQCYILASFLGLGITLASVIQKSHSFWYRKMKMYLFGQAATMNDYHIFLYGGFAVCVLGFVLIFFPFIKAYLFDGQFCKIAGLRLQPVRFVITLLFALIVVIGMRSVGTVLMCGMLVAPGICAKHVAQKFSVIILIACIVSALSAGIGVYLSMIIPEVTSLTSFATGPAIVLVASVFCFFSFLFSPKKGLVVCFFRKLQFKNRCINEHLLKLFWKSTNKPVLKSDVFGWKVASKSMTSFSLKNLRRNGWVERSNDKSYFLTQDGEKKAAYIVRLHRLWELYLSEYLGFSSDQIHRSAEEMEHIIPPEIEKKLTNLLLNPEKDPHNQPIPKKELVT